MARYMEVKLSHQQRRNLEARAVAQGVTVSQEWTGDRYGNSVERWFAKGGEYTSEPSVTRDAALYAAESIAKRLRMDSVR